MEKKDKWTFIIGFSSGVASVLLIALLVFGFIYLKENTSFFKAAVSEKVDGVWTRGNPEAKITVLEYSDIQCPFCARHHETLKRVLENYPNDVRWQYKHFPLDSIHPLARKAAEAAECAGDQGQFWNYLDNLYANQKNINIEIFDEIATGLNLNLEDFKSCLDSSKYKDKVASDLAEGQERGVRGTPGNFVNDTELRGAVPFEDMKAEIDKQLMD